MGGQGGTSSPYHSAAQCDANYSHRSADLNDKPQDFHREKRGQRTTEAQKSADRLTEVIRGTFFSPIKSLSAETKSGYLSCASHQYSEGPRL